MNRRDFLLSSTSGLVLASAVAHAQRNPSHPAIAPGDALPGEWLQVRGDPHLIGRSALRGGIRAPAIAWRYFIGARETLVPVHPAWTPPEPTRSIRDRTKVVRLPAGNIETGRFAQILAEWLPAPPRYDLDGTGSLTPIAPNGQFGIGKFLPDRPGLQKIEFDSLFSRQGDASLPLYGHLFARENGAWVEVWRTEPIPLLFAANVIVGDFDGDGRTEAAFCAWYDIYVLDMATGRTKAKCRFTPENAESGRGYGWFGAFDLDGDGRQEFVLLSDSEHHIGVMGWRDGKLCRLWTRLIERGVSAKKTLVQILHEPVQDVDGDGRREIALSIYNEAGDNRWHTQGIDPMTGRVKIDLPDLLLMGLTDLDGDGVAEMLCARTRGRLLPPMTDLTAYGAKQGRIFERWRLEEASFQTTTTATTILKDHFTDGASTRTLPMLLGPLSPDGPVVFATRRRIAGHAVTSEVQVDLWSAFDGDIRSEGGVQGLGLEVVALRVHHSDLPSVLLRARYRAENRATLTLTGLIGEVAASRTSGVDLCPPVVGRLTRRSKPVVIVPDALDSVVAFRPSSREGQNLEGRHLQGQHPRTLWRVPGWGMTTRALKEGMPSGGVILTDLLGDGWRSVIVAAESPEGFARLVAIDPRGSAQWHTDLPGVPARSSGFPNGFTFWFAGHFLDPVRRDILATSCATNFMMPLLLDGRSGAVLWRNETKSAGGWFAVYDYDGDGLDDALSTFQSVVRVFRGSTGKPLLEIDTGWGGHFRKGTFRGEPVVADVLGKGGSRAPGRDDLQILLAGSQNVTALMERDGRIVWELDSEDAIPPVPAHIMLALADVDGDGRWAFVGPANDPSDRSGRRYCGCYDAQTGRLKWRVPLEAGPTDSPASGDLDGDGRDECLMRVGHTLYAVGASPDGRTGEVRWKLDFPGEIGSPTLADARGDGALGIVVVCADGYVYGIEGSVT